MGRKEFGKFTVMTNKELSKIPRLIQSQESLSKQLSDLIMVANRIGLHDAADWIKDKTDINSILLKATAPFSKLNKAIPDTCGEGNRLDN